jgi:hypothetical protein
VRPLATDMRYECSYCGESFRSMEYATAHVFGAHWLRHLLTRVVHLIRRVICLNS